jgi:hypothetical protein
VVFGEAEVPPEWQKLWPNRDYFLLDGFQTIDPHRLTDRLRYRGGLTKMNRGTSTTRLGGSK